MKRILHYICSEALRLKREDQGVIMAISLAVWMFLFVLICGVYTLGTTIQEREALQHASDAAAISAATIQADALSRMATINKAMSYTYMSMSRKQMDCILMEWLWLVNKRFSEDKVAAKGWMQHFYHSGINKLMAMFTNPWALVAGVADLYNLNNRTKPCGSSSTFRNGELKWFCGAKSKFDHVSMNGDLVSMRQIKDIINQYAIRTGESNDQVAILKAGIAADKQLIKVLNSMLSVVHRSACDSMERTVPEVLQRNLSAVFNSNEMAQVYYSTKLPNGEWNPYYTLLGGNAQSGTYNAGNGYFSPLENTENDERTFLNMMGEISCNNKASSDEKAYKLSSVDVLSEYFMPPPAQENGNIFSFLNMGKKKITVMGIDQWFVRGRVNYGRTPTYKRVEGGLGLQRVYWDSNANSAEGEFRGGGIALASKGPTRGNQLFDASSIDLGPARRNVLFNFLSQLVGQLVEVLDMQPSVMYASRDVRSCQFIRYDEENGGFKRKGDDNGLALVADYEWFSAKWFSTTKKKQFSPTRKCRCDHIPFPKYYCGDVTECKCFDSNLCYRVCGARCDHVLRLCDCNGDECKHDECEDEKRPKYFKRGYVKFPVDVVDMFVDIVYPKVKSGNHGYGSTRPHLLDFVSTISKQIRLNKRTGGDIERSEYRSCAIGLRSGKVFISGCARVYADDKEICDFTYQGANDLGETLGDPEKNIPTRVDIYAGACAQPWILNERFFGTDGTITVAVAKRRANPFAKVINKVWDVEKTSPTSIGNPSGEPDKETYMWTMSSARAAFRQSEGAPLEIAYRYLNPEAGNDCLSDSVGPGETGCVCGETAQRRLAKQWNLCTTYWEPVLLPVALADQYRAVDGKWIEEPWVQQGPLYGISALWKFFYLDMKAVQSQTGEVNVDASELGWRSLGGGDPMVDPELNFLRIESPARKDNKYFEIFRQDSATGSQSPLLYKQKLQ